MSVAEPPPPRLQMREITQRYPGVTANNAIDLGVKAGEIHALFGENGAGKTTLMKILFQPTRSLDVGNIEFIHKQATCRRDADTGIPFVPAKLDEIVVLVDGRPTTNNEETGLLMATGSRAPAEGPPTGMSGQAEAAPDTSVRGGIS